MVYCADNRVNIVEKEIKILNWIDKSLANGQFCFTSKLIDRHLPIKSKVALKRKLDRLVAKGKIVSIHKGFYIIISPAYQNMGILPPEMFMDDMMGYLKRPYYISLLSAASLHGAAHQQPQVHFVCTTLPSMRDTNKNGMQIKYVSKRNFPESHLIQKKTESGYVNLSDPILTCLDLINYYKTIGGFNRAATVINELSEEITDNEVTYSILQLAKNANIQRLGYLWEYECGQVGLANALFKIVKEPLRSFKTYKLNPSRDLQKQIIKNRWKINVNIEIEIDE